MSGVVKAVKKIFKKVVNVVKKIWKPLLIAAAVYFTAGVALSAFPATAGFAASMPGFAGGGVLGTGIGAGATAGTGIFSTAAAKIGLGALGAHGGLAGAAMASGTTASALGAAGFSTAATAKAAAAYTGSIMGASEAALGASPAIGAVSGAATGAGTGSGVIAPAATTPTAPAVAKAGMSLSDKLLLASVGTQAVGTLLTPSPEEEKDFQGSFYGVDKKGRGSPIVPGAIQTAQAAPEKGGNVPGAPVPGVNPPSSGINFANLFEQAAPQGKQTSKYEVTPEDQPPDLFEQMRGVRYVA